MKARRTEPLVSPITGRKEIAQPVVTSDFTVSEIQTGPQATDLPKYPQIYIAVNETKGIGDQANSDSVDNDQVKEYFKLGVQMALRKFADELKVSPDTIYSGAALFMYDAVGLVKLMS